LFSCQRCTGNLLRKPQAGSDWSIVDRCTYRQARDIEKKNPVHHQAAHESLSWSHPSSITLFSQLLCIVCLLAPIVPLV
jgi:hypothetical protein